MIVDADKESLKPTSSNKRRATLPARLGMISARQDGAFRTAMSIQPRTHKATNSSKGQLHVIASRHAPADLHCKLCNGLLDDAVTIIGCNHRFCRSCLFPHLAQRMACPACAQQRFQEGNDDNILIHSGERKDKVNDVKDDKSESKLNGSEHKQKERMQGVVKDEEGTSKKRSKDTAERASIEVKALPEVQAVINKLRAPCPRAAKGNCDLKHPMLIPDLRKHLLTCCSSDIQTGLGKEINEKRESSALHKACVRRTAVPDERMIKKCVDDGCSDCAATRADIHAAMQEYEKVTRELHELRSVITAREERQRRQVMDRLASLSTMQYRSGEMIENKKSETPSTESIEIVDGKEVRWRIKIQYATPLSNIYDVVRQKLDKKEVILCCDGPINMGGTIIKENDTLGSLGMICEHSVAASATQPLPAARLWVEYV